MSETTAARLTPETVQMEMLAYDGGDPARIQHFIKVHSFSRMIGKGEGMDPESLRRLEITALMHDIGIRPAEEKYGSCSGPLQEQEGPPVARAMLERLCCEPETIDRVCYLIGHHHTYSGIDGLDYQILVEADFLVNLFEDHADAKAVSSAYRKIFRTRTGREICRLMFGELCQERDDG